MRSQPRCFYLIRIGEADHTQVQLLLESRSFLIFSAHSSASSLDAKDAYANPDSLPNTQKSPVPSSRSTSKSVSILIASFRVIAVRLSSKWGFDDLLRLGQELLFVEPERHLLTNIDVEDLPCCLQEVWKLVRLDLSEQLLVPANIGVFDRLFQRQFTTDKLDHGLEL